MKKPAKISSMAEAAPAAKRSISLSLAQNVRED
jgi:hypothetical protein